MLVGAVRKSFLHAEGEVGTVIFQREGRTRAVGEALWNRITVPVVGESRGKRKPPRR